MRVLIVENEMYLAQSISNKLSANNYTCFVENEVSSVDKEAHYDVLLLSTSVDNFEKLIPVFKNSVIILLTAYISMDTVVNPLNAGALDYMQKPFMIEELIRKIEHFQKSIGELVKISTKAKESIEAKLLAVDGDLISLETQEGVLKLEFSEIKKARTFILWDK